MADDASKTSPSERFCAKCKKNPATLALRSDSTCPSCFQSFVLNKAVKRLGVLRKDLVAPNEKRTCRYLTGLSFGPSSAALTYILHENLKYVRARANVNSPAAYELVVLHVDTDLTPQSEGQASPAEQLLEEYRHRFDGIDFRCVPLSSALDLPSVDWSALPKTDESLEPRARIQALFDGLPSVTSRADVLRLLVRHLLLSVAVENKCEALLLGCTTTALAELTLAEVAKGRGFSVTWQINDGPFPIPSGLTPASPPITTGTNITSPAGAPPQPTGDARTPATIQIYYPIRDVFRKEIHTYLHLASPPLTDLVVSDTSTSGDVVSHKDLSIEEAMVRYFESVEESYPAVVANVVRTTGKLSRADGHVSCSVCGMAVDEQGDERWKGEIGADQTRDGGSSRGGQEGAQKASRLCYGCERSIRG